MLNIYIMSVIMLLSVLGIYFLAKEITSLILKNKYESCVVLQIRGNKNNVECVIRDALAANPNSDIIIVDKSNNSEIHSIIKSFERDYEQIHIKTAPEK